MDNLCSIQGQPIRRVNFGDVTTLFKNPECLRTISDETYELYRNEDITKIIGIESRDFVISSAIAIKLGVGIVLCHKPGELPCETVQGSYAKEYGIDTIGIHKDTIGEDGIILLHDDLLTTGGTMKATCDLVKEFHPKKVYANFVIELKSKSPHCREQFDKDIEIESLLRF